MAVSLRSNTHLSTRLLLHACLAQVGIIALSPRWIFPWDPLHPRIQRELRADAQNFGRLRPRLVLAAQLGIVNDELFMSPQGIGIAVEVPLEDGDRFLVPPHLVV